jgi:rhodanese-related sulfurtransferase
MIAQTGPIAGAVVAEHDRLEHAVRDWPKHRAVVTMCACPQDAGAIEAARRLLAQGYLDARPLKGGYDAWMQVAASTGNATGSTPAIDVPPRTGSSSASRSTSRP